MIDNFWLIKLMISIKSVQVSKGQTISPVQSSPLDLKQKKYIIFYSHKCGFDVTKYC